jgi:hypothetical protein
MATPTTTAQDAARERLRTTVAAILADVYDRTTDPDAAEQAVMDAAQQWGTEGYVINATPAEPCPGNGYGNGGTVSRWYAPNGWQDTPPIDANADADPGSYTVGERVTCPRCSASVAVERVKTTKRETGTQYVAWLARH